MRLPVSQILSVGRGALCALGLVLGAASAQAAGAVKWDYADKPIKVTSGTDKQPAWWRNSIADGYPTSLAQPIIRTYWRQDPPTPEAPQELVFEYPEAVTVSRFVHYYTRTPQPNALRDVRVFTRDEAGTWTLLQELKDLPIDGAQILGIDAPRPSKYYRFLIDRVADDAAVRILEIETWTGTALGNVRVTAEDGGPAVAMEPCVMTAKFYLDADAQPARVRVVRDIGIEEEKIIEYGASAYESPSGAGRVAEVTFPIEGLREGVQLLDVNLENEAGEVIDHLESLAVVQPKLVFEQLSGVEARILKAGEKLAISGQIRNAGKQPAKAAWVSWGAYKKQELGPLEPGQSLPFEFSVTVGDSNQESGGSLSARDGDQTVTFRHLPQFVLTEQQGESFSTDAKVHYEITGSSVTLTLPVGGSSATQKVYLWGSLADNKPLEWALDQNYPPQLVAPLTGGLLFLEIEPSGPITGEPIISAHFRPNHANPITPPRIDLDLFLAVDDPQVMFRPQIDWYETTKGANYEPLAYGHNSATRMLTLQTSDSTLTVVPDTDHLSWGFTKTNAIQMRFPLFLEDQQRLPEGTWMPVNQSPLEFRLTLMPRKGDWWEAYRHVVQDYFKFEQPRQWALPVTQMQMHNARYIMSYPVWSEKWKNVRTWPYMEFFYNFYGSTYTLPALYSWYLATDDPTARDKASMVADWMLKTQEKEGPLAGGWFSQYGEGLNNTLVGGDQAGNRWLMPHSTGTSIKTLLWYWEASGRKRDDVLAAARKGCDWLLAHQRADGGWPYAFDLEGKAVTDLGDAGQIWCSWALLRMTAATDEPQYKEAALKSLEYFKRTFMDRHRYEGYWEDVSGAAGKVTRSWEGYEPAIAIMVFSEVGDHEAALHCGRDAATWTWTRVIDTRTYETCYGQTTEQSLCGPSQAQSPMNALGMTELYAKTGDTLWQDYAGAIKAINFCADAEQGYGMVATCGWDDPLTGVIGPAFEGQRPFIAPNNAGEGQFGRGVWAEWQTAQFAWLALEWLLREANLRAPEIVKINPETLRGEVLGQPGRVKMPEEKCDVMGVAHYDINWAGFRNDDHYALIVMNHKEATDVLIRPHEAHLDCKTQEPRILTGQGGKLTEAKATRDGVNYRVALPEKGTAVLIWERLE